MSTLVLNIHFNLWFLSPFDVCRPLCVLQDEIRVVDRFHWTTFLLKGAFTKKLQTFYVSLQFTDNNFRNLVDPPHTHTHTHTETARSGSPQLIIVRLRCKIISASSLILAMKLGNPSSIGSLLIVFSSLQGSLCRCAHFSNDYFHIYTNSQL